MAAGEKEFGWLPDKDSNLDKLIQNQLCYRYTIGQSQVFILTRFP